MRLSSIEGPVQYDFFYNLSILFFVITTIYIQNDIIVLLGCLSAIVAFLRRFRTDRAFTISSVFFLILLTFGYLGELFLRPTKSLVLFHVVPQLLVARYLWLTKDSRLIKAFFYYYSFAFLFAVGILGVPSGDMIEGSHNRVSTFVLALACFIYCVEKKPGILPAALTFCMCVLAKGSSGIICGTLLLFLVLVHHRSWFGGILIVFLTYATYLALNRYGIDIASFEFLMKLNWERLFGEDIRYIIIADYFNKIGNDWIYWFTGVHDWSVSYLHPGLNRVVEIDNLHNSYLGIHMKFGVFGLLILALVASVLIKLLFQGDYFFFFVLMILLIRGFSDTNIILFGYLNFCFFIVFFMKTSERRSSLDLESRSG